MTPNKFTFLKETTNAAFLQKGINKVIYKSLPAKEYQTQCLSALSLTALQMSFESHSGTV